MMVVQCVFAWKLGLCYIDKDLAKGTLNEREKNYV